MRTDTSCFFPVCSINNTRPNSGSPENPRNYEPTSYDTILMVLIGILIGLGALMVVAPLICKLLGRPQTADGAVEPAPRRHRREPMFNASAANSANVIVEMQAPGNR